MLIIAHRGASAYLPEHTLPAKAMAHGMGADYLEQDLVASKDGELLVLHDIYLDRVSDVASVFPDRARADGRFYAIDFTLEEIRRLRVTERLNEDGSPVYPGRFPAGFGPLRIHTLEEELDFIRGLNRSTGREAGVYPEIKRPAWHRAEGIDMTPKVLETLEAFEYCGVDDPVYLQCFDPRELRRVRDELGSNLRLVQLIGDNSWEEADVDYDAMRSEAGLRDAAAVADGFGPWIGHLYRQAPDGRVQPTAFAGRLKALGRECHPYTLRADDLQPGFHDAAGLLHFLQREAGANGVFSDHPDIARRAEKAAKELF